MGMFDYIAFQFNCPKCGEPLTDFQSKEKECTLATYYAYEVTHFYSSCDNDKCDTFINFYLQDSGRYEVVAEDLLSASIQVSSEIFIDNLDNTIIIEDES